MNESYTHQKSSGSENVDDVQQKNEIQSKMTNTYLNSNLVEVIDLDLNKSENIVNKVIFPDNKLIENLLNTNIIFAKQKIRDFIIQKKKCTEIARIKIKHKKFLKTIDEIITIYLQYFKLLLIENDRFAKFLENILEHDEKFK